MWCGRAAVAGGVVRPQVGRGIIHLGTHRHGADDIVSGERYSLIVWNTGVYRYGSFFPCASPHPLPPTPLRSSPRPSPYAAVHFDQSTSRRHSDSEQYKRTHGRNLHGTDKGEPDRICLSYTHDPDYGEYLAYPTGKLAKPEARRMHVARFSSAEAAAKAAALKANGTEDFRQSEWSAAACKYACGIEYARSAGGDAAAELLGPLLLNEAQCRLKLNEADKAEQLCSAALEREPKNVKACHPLPTTLAPPAAIPLHLCHVNRSREQLAATVGRRFIGVRWRGWRRMITRALRLT